MYMPPNYGAHPGGAPNDYYGSYGSYGSRRKVQPSTKHSRHRPRDWLVLSVFSFLCCCPCLGFLAVIFSHMSRFEFIEGNYRKAASKGRAALWLSIVAMVATILISTILIVGFIECWYGAYHYLYGACTST